MAVDTHWRKISAVCRGFNNCTASIFVRCGRDMEFLRIVLKSYSVDRFNWDETSLNTVVAAVRD